MEAHRTLIAVGGSMAIAFICVLLSTAPDAPVVSELQPTRAELGDTLALQTDVARAMVFEYGMSDGAAARTMRADNYALSEATKAVRDLEQARLTDEAYEEALRLLEKHRATLDARHTFPSGAFGWILGR